MAIRHTASAVEKSFTIPRPWLRFDTPMQIVLMAVPLLVLLAITTCAIELSALILRNRVRWVHALVFAVVITVLSLAGQGISARWGFAAGLGIGVVLEVALGSWFFGERGKRKAGEQIGLAGGFVLTVVAQLILVAVGLALIWAVQAFRD